MTSVNENPAASQHSVTHNTFVLERVYPAPPNRVFAAFADPARKRRWFAEGDHHTVEEFQMDFHVGGNERLRYCMNESTPFPGAELLNESTFQDIVTDRRIVTASLMTLAGKRISVSLVTFEFLPSDQGTRLIFTHQGAFFEGSDGPQLREAGWRQLFEKLAKDLAR